MDNPTDTTEEPPIHICREPHRPVWGPTWRPAWGAACSAVCGVKNRAHVPHPEVGFCINRTAAVQAPFRDDLSSRPWSQRLFAAVFDLRMSGVRREIILEGVGIPGPGP
jgi:hypothetical protein